MTAAVQYPDVPFVAQALASLAPGAQWAVHGDTTDRLEWLDDVIPQPEVAAINAEAERIKGLPVQTIVPALGAIRALRQRGLYDQVLAAVQVSTNPDALDSWNRAATWSRDSVWINDLAPVLGLTSADIDALFALAKTLV